MKKIFLVASVLCSTLVWGVNLTGTVKTDTETPVAGAVVSDGFSVVRTDANGAYTMPYNPSSEYVFVSVPSGYDFPADDTGFTKIWQAIDKSASTHQHNFTLHRQEDGGKADSCHVLLVLSDPQVFDEYSLWRFRNQTVEDIKHFTASYPQGTKFLTLTVGDLVWDTYKYFDEQKANYEAMGIPSFIVIGNHDHKSGTTGSDSAKVDSIAAIGWQNIYGPTYYSFNKGAIHYVVLDNVFYTATGDAKKGYKSILTDKQKNWLKKDIAELDSGTQVIYAMHIDADNNANDLKLLKNLIEPLKSCCHIVSGHTHTNTVKVMTTNWIEHNVAAVQGQFWCSDWCGDGAPNGYKVFETGPQGMTNWFYKGTGWNKDFCMSTFPTNSINAGNSKPTSVLANIWDYDITCTVKFVENGVARTVKNFTGKDPAIYDLMMDYGDTRPNYPGTEGGSSSADKNPGAKETFHMFAYQPADPNARLEVVFTDHFGVEHRAPILKHMMVASFTQNNDQEWVYLQDFNTLPSYPNYVKDNIRRGTWSEGHTPIGWYASTSQTVLPGQGTVNWGGYNYIDIDNGAQNIGWIKSYGSMGATHEQNGRDRSMGSLNTDKAKRISYGVLIENNTGGIITDLDITYTGEVWRLGSNASNKETLKFGYAILTDEQATDIRDTKPDGRTGGKTWVGQIATTPVGLLDFTTPSALSSTQANAAIDGKNSQNREQVSGKIELTLQPGEVILLRWDDDLATNNTDQAFAIDDVQIKATSIPSAINETNASMLQRISPSRVIFNKGEVFIQTDKDTYTLSGQKR